jgi:hypothetical protein
VGDEPSRPDVSRYSEGFWRARRATRPGPRVPPAPASNRVRSPEPGLPCYPRASSTIAARTSKHRAAPALGPTASGASARRSRRSWLGRSLKSSTAFSVLADHVELKHGSVRFYYRGGSRQRAQPVFVQLPVRIESRSAQSSFVGARTSFLPSSFQLYEEALSSGQKKPSPM